MKDFICLGIVIFLTCFVGTFLGFYIFDYFNEPKVYQVRTCQDLQDMNKDLDGVYILMNDIDCKEYLNGN